MKTVSPKTKLYMTLFAVIFIFLALAFGAILPLIRRISAISEKFSDTRQQIANIEEKRSQILKLEKEYEAIKDSISLINRSLGDSSNFLDILIRLEQTAGQTGNKYEIAIVEDSASAKKPEQSAEPKKYLTFKTVIYGSFANSMSFINHLENADFYASIEKIEMTKLDKLTVDQSSLGVKEGDIKTSMEIKIFTK